MLSTDQPADPQSPAESLRGADLIRRFASTLPETPGVYQMQDQRGKVLYVGKAIRLRSRVMSYTRVGKLSGRIRRMVHATRSMHVEHVHTNAEALLLEMTLIKQLKPRANVLLRDDKSFPFLRLNRSESYPRLSLYRGHKRLHGSESRNIFGPFASAHAAHTTLETLQKAFLLRVCSDATFATRQRPCLLYQIKRCSAPCVGKISQEHYADLVNQTIRFFNGRNHEIQEQLANAMDQASAEERFEFAAELRDRIRALNATQSTQSIRLAGLPNTDVVVLHQDSTTLGVRIAFYRSGSANGSRDQFIPLHSAPDNDHERLVSILAQLYERHPPPSLILTNLTTEHTTDLSEALSHLAKRKVRIITPRQGRKKQLVDFSLVHLRQVLAQHAIQVAQQSDSLARLASCLQLTDIPRRVEVFDNSHLQGTHPVGALIVVGEDGFIKRDYRKFIIRQSSETNPDPAIVNNDIAMMREVLQRRFQRLDLEDAEAIIPDVVLLDGGPAQLAVGQEVLADLGLTQRIALGAISKGPGRQVNQERLYRTGDPNPLLFDSRDLLLLFLQAIRDEAHRFVITFHRSRRSKEAVKNPLDTIEGIGPTRKQSLMRRFGSVRDIRTTGVEDLLTVRGISRNIAERIYNHFH